ncbi:MAG: DUF4445 domain-containing protein [Phycisphaerae bacterium]|nr:DUF4445 domain-containing protein [Phycisphaerae bacterium]NIP50477.1 DUF4445 domain-containing protein [Phycisphaerae bacterium]NIS51257.1 DUF4445 domain-containing protein [Phycisphaerae bacterium]NIU07364.1 DUF4445 domain-containing protein [Phycisphaerae bacterium]NIU56544.1 DUF4445 domain-containing protein [Phycisphaerae bacterium]
MKHFKITFKPDDREITIHKGATLFEAAGQAGIILNTACGGRGICGKCEVILELGGEKVLACQYRIERDLVVTIPVSSRFFEQKILAEGIETTGIQPDIYEKYLKIQPEEQILGVAVDIGTTTVVARLINMQDGRCLATQTTLNPQTQYGDDVVSRIAFAETDAKLCELQKVITDCVNELIGRLCEKTSIDSKQIFEVCAVGNTTMNHIFLNLPIEQLGRAPYKAFSLDAKDKPAEESALRINPAGNVHTVENISGFVGSDITSVALAIDIDTFEKVSLIVDIGTNGEIVLGTAEKFYAASCAAGPAFEGARISCGSRAVEGAIEAVVINENDIVLDVIGNNKAHSICGSGLIDTVAVLIDLGIIDTTGRFVEITTIKDKLPSTIYSRIIEKDGQPAFVLDDVQKVVLTQADIRQVQLAKAAIRAGIILSERKLGIADSDIEQIFLAGAFGNYIRAESALRLKMLPDVPSERIRFVGNAASSGAQMILLSRQSREKAGQLARKIEYIEIAHQPEFQDVFADCMTF